MRDGDMDADRIIELLELEPHPEGGYFRETFRDARVVEGRPCSTSIYFLLKEGQVSHWHRVGRWPRTNCPARTITTYRRAPAGRHSCASLAACQEPRPLDSRRVHGCSRLRILRLRTRRSQFSPESRKVSQPSAGTIR